MKEEAEQGWIRWMLKTEHELENEYSKRENQKKKLELLGGEEQREKEREKREIKEKMRKEKEKEKQQKEVEQEQEQYEQQQEKNIISYDLQSDTIDQTQNDGPFSGDERMPLLSEQNAYSNNSLVSPSLSYQTLINVESELKEAINGEIGRFNVVDKDYKQGNNTQLDQMKIPIIQSQHRIKGIKYRSGSIRGFQRPISRKGGIIPKIFHDVVLKGNNNNGTINRKQSRSKLRKRNKSVSSSTSSQSKHKHSSSSSSSSFLSTPSSPSTSQYSLFNISTTSLTSIETDEVDWDEEDEQEKRQRDGLKIMSAFSHSEDEDDNQQQDRIKDGKQRRRQKKKLMEQQQEIRKKNKKGKYRQGLSKRRGRQIEQIEQDGDISIIKKNSQKRKKKKKQKDKQQQIEEDNILPDMIIQSTMAQNALIEEGNVIQRELGR
ncbi:MAG: hypothetical protein EZS28_021687 [Streblomastix strix]|uniref:Uncharacterized protein n=1 Tax=Streblomastix strix TaxID=222440 RepID=A0A5J4VK08_9EUKA|nr:MAG: hypothetical protein EZS28_021687 [Streblomastix strix]